MNKFFIKIMMVTCLLFFFTGMMQLSSNDKTSAVQQGITITGTVTDDKEPLPGVNIMIKGTSIGQVTDSNGRYSIAVPNADATLVFSFVGYVTEEITVGERRIIDLTLAESSSQIEEVVVVGYGSQKKVNLTGAVGVVSGQDITSKAATDVTTALQGQIPGLTVTREGGQPGKEGTGIKIRGFTSVNDAKALVLVDGVEGSLDGLNAEDIESISVLKDAASASIYGSRAAGGVILVTTKKGAAERIKLSYDGSFGINVPGRVIQRLPPWEEFSMIHEAYYNWTPTWAWNKFASETIANPNFSTMPMGTRWEAYGVNNWMDECMRDYNTQQTHSVSVSGGNERTNYYVSGGFFTRGGIFKYGPDDNNRINLRASVNTELNKYLDLSIQMAYIGTTRREIAANSGVGDVLQLIYQAPNYNPIYLPEVDTNYDINPYFNFAQNPVQVIKEGGERKFQTQTFTGIANLRLKNLVKDLTIDLNVSRRAIFEQNQFDHRFLQAYGRNGSLGTSSLNNPQRVQKEKANAYQDKLEAIANYSLTWNNHNIHLLGGASYEQYRRDYISGTARNGISNDMFTFNFYNNSDAGNSVLADKVQPWKMASLFGRVNYNFAERYLLEATLRYDGSSRLSPGNRFELFPSVSAGWRVSEETFFSGAKDFVNNLKIRASWGQLGNSTVLDDLYYPYYDVITREMYYGDNAPVYFSQNMVSSNLKWETVTSTNVGIDMAFLKHRLNVTAEMYWKKNDNMLARIRSGNIIGFPADRLPVENVGELKVRGWELSLQWRDRIGDLTYNVGVNIDDSKNELVRYTGTNAITEGTVNFLEGYPLYTIWGYESNGFWKSRDEYLAYKTANPGYETIENDVRISGGDTRYLTQGKADHKVSPGKGSPEDHGDMVTLGNTNPRYLFGVNLGAQWKGFDFSMFWQGVGKRSYLMNRDILGAMVSASVSPKKHHRDHWREDNQGAYLARMIAGQTFNYHTADRWVQNGAYIRLKNIQLGYTVPISATWIQTLRIYVTGTDVWEYTKALKIFDPEVKDNTFLNYYPFFRTWTVGVNLTF